MNIKIKFWLFIIISFLLLIICENGFSQTITKKYKRTVNKYPATVQFYFVVDSKILYKTTLELFLGKQVGDKVDTTSLIYEGKLNLQSGSEIDSNKVQELSNEEKELLYFVEQINKMEQQINELKKSKEQMVGILTYLSKKYNLDIQQVIKKISK